MPTLVAPTLAARRASARLLASRLAITAPLVGGSPAARGAAAARPTKGEAMGPVLMAGATNPVDQVTPPTPLPSLPKAKTRARVVQGTAPACRTSSGAVPNYGT